MNDFQFGLTKASYRYFFFDMDNTLTRSKSIISDEMKVALYIFSLLRDVIIVSGASYEQIIKQITPSLRKNICIMAQNGNHVVYPYRNELWNNKIKDENKVEIFDHIKKIQSFLKKVNDDMVQDRGCQISLSCVGHNAKISVKEKFDPNFSCF